MPHKMKTVLRRVEFLSEYFHKYTTPTSRLSTIAVPEKYSEINFKFDRIQLIIPFLSNTIGFVIET